MTPKNLQRGQDYAGFDIPYLRRSICRFLQIILMTAGICGIVSFIFLNYYMPAEYTATTNLAVIPRDNSASKLNDYNMNAAVARCMSALNSDTLKDQMRKTEDGEKLAGRVEAEQTGSSNVIKLKASAGTSQDAFRLLKAALKAYPSLSGYFESGYLLNSLEPPSANYITAGRDKSMLYSCVVILMVLIAGAGLVVLKCLFGDKIYSGDQAACLLDADYLGSIVYQKKNKQKSILISQSATDIAYVEEMDKLTTRIQEKMENSQMKSLMIASIKENEGKSTVAANLALSFVRRGKRVMLIDADLRRPALAKIFDITLEKEQELSEYLKGNSELGQVIYKGRERELYCVFQCSPEAEPDKLLTRQAFRELFRLMSGKVDYILFDTPPVGIVRDSEAIAEFCDAAVVVMRQDRVGAGMVNDVTDTLEEAGANVLGCVLNAVKGGGTSGDRRKKYDRYYSSYGKES